MKRNKTYIIRWDKEPSLFRLDSFEKRFGRGISDERCMLMPYFSLHVYNMSTLAEGDCFYLLNENGLIMKGVILSSPYQGYKGDKDQYFADIYPEFAAHPESGKLLTLPEIENAVPGILSMEGPLDRKSAAAIEALFNGYRDKIMPIDSDFSSTPLAISSHVRFPALVSKTPSIIEEIDYRRYLQSKSMIIEGYQKYEINGVWHYRINVHNFRLFKVFLEIAKSLYGDKKLSILFGLCDEDYCENDGLTAEEAEKYLVDEIRDIEENTLFNILFKELNGSADEASYMTPDKEILVSTRNRKLMDSILSRIGIREKDKLLYMSQFITKESNGMKKAYNLVDCIADVLPMTMYFGEDDEDEDSV